MDDFMNTFLDDVDQEFSRDATLQRRLAELNRFRMQPTLPDQHAKSFDLTQEFDLRTLEEQFVASERARVQAVAATVPCDADGFLFWFEALREHGPGQGDPLFPWLMECASLPELRWFIGQEAAGEAGFEDLLAMTQMCFPERAKLEMARNFWDELGRGRANGMHGPMLARLVDTVGAALPVDVIIPESLALGNLMMALAANRRYAYQSVGALGVIELTAPSRAVYVNQALRSHGFSPQQRQYFALHATLDKLHSQAWNREVLAPLVEENPCVAPALAEGALMRLHAGARCFNRYREILKVDATAIPMPPVLHDLHG